MVPLIVRLYIKVKPAMSDHPWNTKMVLYDRWSIIAGTNAYKCRAMFLSMLVSNGRCHLIAVVIKMQVSLYNVYQPLVAIKVKVK